MLDENTCLLKGTDKLIKGSKNKSNKYGAYIPLSQYQWFKMGEKWKGNKTPFCKKRTRAESKGKGAFLQTSYIKGTLLKRDKV